MIVLLDASVWLAAADEDDPFHAAAARLARSSDLDHAALDLTSYEVANVATGSWHDPARAARLCRAIATLCADRIASVGEDLIETAIRLADEHGITVYDAAYVAAATRFGWTLVSADMKDLVNRGLALAPDAGALSG